MSTYQLTPLSVIRKIWIHPLRLLKLSLKRSILFLEWGRCGRETPSESPLISGVKSGKTNHRWLPSVSGGSEGAWFVGAYRFYKQDALIEPGRESECSALASACGFYTQAVAFGVDSIKAFIKKICTHSSLQKGI